MANPRREFLLKALNVDSLKGLEIGPLNKPLVRNEDVQEGGEIFYLDHLPTCELKEKYKDDLSIDVNQIVPVDFVCTDGNIVGATAGNLFDYVIASHVIEHAPNLLQFLKDIQTILKPGGQVFLVVPDKRFTFDFNRPLTTFGTALENLLTNVELPRISAVYDQAAMATNANGHNLWHGIVKAEDSNLLASEATAWKAALRVHKESFYYDVHVNIFTPESFFEILKKALLHEVVFYEVKQFLDTQIGQIEFMVQLEKPKDEPNNCLKSKCLASLPKFEIESLLSPYMPQVKALSDALQNSTEIISKFQHQLDVVRKDSDNKITNLQKELKIANEMLDRKSVKIILLSIDKIYSFLRK
ncbi:MAG: hypothetical protein CMJ13_08655 [Pelagibacterales bacterium]|nr:hypothetical protein [Pelagibacterales bacterium]|tara:strand:- start:492 stop:1562 length:1071 start_codon:yes stop_codon:yes gene_type:complete